MDGIKVVGRFMVLGQLLVHQDGNVSADKLQRSVCCDGIPIVTISLAEAMTPGRKWQRARNDKEGRRGNRRIYEGRKTTAKSAESKLRLPKKLK